MVLPILLFLLVQRLQATGKTVVKTIHEIYSLFQSIEWCYSK